MMLSKPNLSDVSILVVGDIMLDRYWFGQVDRISPEAPVPVVKIERSEDRLGGAANVARNIASLGASVTLIGMIGTDEAGEKVTSLLKVSGIENRLITQSNIPTITKTRVMGRQQQLLRVDLEQRPEAHSVDSLIDQVSKAFARHDIIVLSDYAKGALDQVANLINTVKGKKLILVDPKGHDYSRYAGASLLTPNRAELKEAIGPWKDESELEHKAQLFRQQLNLEALLVTRSEQGMTLFTSAGREHVDARAREVFDVSGAGDTVIATLATLLAAKQPLFDAVRWANLAAGIVVGKVGTSVVTPTELFEQGIRP